MKINPIIFIILLFCLSVTSVNAWLGSYDEQLAWEEFGNSPYNRQREIDHANEWTQTGLTSIKSNSGHDFQPLIYDIDNDGLTEIIISTGNYLQILEWNSDSLILDDEYLNSGSLRSMMSLLPDVNNNGYYEIAGVFGTTNITIFEYNGTSINVLYTNSTNNYNIQSGLRCINHTGNITCYASAWNGTYAGIIEFNTENGEMSAINLSTNNIFDTTWGIYSSPPAYDVNRDGNIDIVFIADYDDDSYEGYVIYDVTSQTLISTISEVNSYAIITMIGIENIDGGGDYELIISWNYNPAQVNGYSAITVFDWDGTEIWENEVFDDAGGYDLYNTGFAIGNIDGTGNLEVCAGAIRTSLFQFTKIKCFDIETGKIRFTWGTDGHKINNGMPSFPVMADMDSDGKDEIIFHESYFNLDINYTLNNINIIVNPDESYDRHPALADINGDGLLDICETEATTTFCSLSTAENLPPTINESYNYGGFTANYDYTSPICVNTTIIFEGLQGTDGNYNNDFDADQERIVTNCGFHNETHESIGTQYSSYLGYGDYSYINPSFSCYYNNTGTYRVRLYLQDNQNTDDYNVYQNDIIIIRVIDGEEGVTCNDPPITLEDLESGTSATSQEDSTNDAIETTLGSLFGVGSGSDMLKMIIGLAIIIGIIVMTAQHGITNGTALLIIGIISMLMVTFIGLIPLAIFIIFSIITFFIFLLSKTLGTGPGGA